MKADNPLKVLLSFRKLRSLVYDLQKDFFKACEGSDAIIYHPGAAIFPETEGYFKEVEVPILLYVGEEDEWGHFPRAKEFSESKADVTLVSFPKRGHDVHSSKDLVFPYVKEFLESIN